MKRKAHETLIGDERKVAAVILFFFKLFRGLRKDSI
jgi:hypothetical protein